MTNIVNKIAIFTLVTFLFLNVEKSFAEDPAIEPKEKESIATEESSTESTEEKKDPHAGHNHPPVGMDKNSPEYKEIIKKQIEAYEAEKKRVKEFDDSDEFNSELLTKDLPFDVNIGDPNAPVTIVEYASLSCSHCKQFHENIYYPLKKDYIDAGKVFFKYRHFPLNSPALKAALVVNCSKEGNKQALVGALFKGQSQWAYSKSDTALYDRMKTISKIGGLTTEEFKSCYDNESKQEELITLMKEAAEGVRINSTPTIFVNGVRYDGSREYELFSKDLDEVILRKTAK